MLKYFPTTTYNFGNTGGIQIITNLFKDVNINIDNIELIRKETINPRERPEQLSYRLYNSFDYYWILLLLNNIKNPFDWNKILGQYTDYKDLDTYDAKAVQFNNSSPFLPNEAESGITYNGIFKKLYSTDITDSYDGITFSGINPGDTILFETGLGAYGIRCVGAGIIPESNVAKQINTSTGDIEDYIHYGQSIVPMEFDFQKDVTQLTAGKDFTCVLDKYGQIHCWGRELTLLPFVGATPTNFRQITPNYIQSVRTGYKFIEASKRKLVTVNSSNFLEFYGDCLAELALYNAGVTTGVKTSWFHINDSGSAGGVLLKSDGKLIDYGTSAPTGVTFIDVACGDHFCVGLMSNSGLTAWGQNTYGQLNIPLGVRFTDIAVTYNHALALRDNLICGWGLSASGQLNIPAGKKFKAISAGKHHSAALTVNNELICWGKIPRAGFSGASIQGITYSGYTLENYTIYGQYDRIYSGDHHVVLRGITGVNQQFIAKIDQVDDSYKRLICKYYAGVLSGNQDIFIDDPTGMVVTILRNGTEVKQILNQLVAIQDIKNLVIQIQDEYNILSITKDIWKTIFIPNFKNAQSDNRFITVIKQYNNYSLKIKQDFFYVNPTLVQKINTKLSQDLQYGNPTNYNLSDLDK